DPLLVGAALQVFQALLDGVLVGAGEGRVDEVAGVGVTRVDRQAGAVLDGAADLIDTAVDRKVDLRIDPLAEEVHAQGDQVDVAGALAVPEEAPLDTVTAGHQTELGGGDSGAA